MRKHLGWLVGVAAVAFWCFWLQLMLAAWGAGELGAAAVRPWLTAYFVAACVLTGIATHLRRG